MGRSPFPVLLHALQSQVLIIPRAQSSTVLRIHLLSKSGGMDAEDKGPIAYRAP